MDATLHDWSEVPADHPMALIERRRVIGERVMISRVVLAEGFSVPTHAHENEQMAVIVSGRLRFGIGAEGSGERREIVASAGQVVHLPSNVPHSAEALEETVVLDVFSPVSERTGVDG